jgi:hypothetical protein
MSIMRKSMCWGEVVGWGCVLKHNMLIILSHHSSSTFEHICLPATSFFHRVLVMPLVCQRAKDSTLSSAGGEQEGSRSHPYNRPGKRRAAEADMADVEAPNAAAASSGALPAEHEKGKGKGDKNKTKHNEIKKQLAAKDKSLVPLFSLMMKAILRSSQINRDFIQCCLVTIVLSSDSKLILDLHDEGRNWAALRNEDTDVELMPPHIAKFTRMISSLLQQRLTAYQVVLDDQELEETCDQIRFLKTDKMFDSKKTRLSLAIERCEAKPNIMSALKQLGGILKHGRMPPGAMEVELGKWLSAFSQ